MPRTLTEEKTIYTYSELDDKGKQKVVNDYVDDIYFSFYKDRPSECEEELMYIGEELLKDSKFKSASVTGAWCDFSYSQGSGAVINFEYKSDDFFADFPEATEEILEMFKSNETWTRQYELEPEEVEQVEKILKDDIRKVVEVTFEVKHETRYANWDLDWDVYCHIPTIRYCIEDLVSDWIHEKFWEDRSLIDDVESSFSSAGYDWYEKISDINNYNDDAFEDQYFYEGGKFACYGSDLD